MRHAQSRLGVELHTQERVCKRRSLGMPSDRGTWVRISVIDPVCAAERTGLEATAALPEAVRHPEWIQTATWRDDAWVWRAEETELVTEPVIQDGGVLTQAPQLPDSWWSELGAALTALATVPMTRVATPHTRPVTQERVEAMVARAFPGVQARVHEWRCAHADFSWVNLTGPRLRVLDWEDVGLAPRGWDAATLWAASLAVPGLAEQVARTCADDLASPTGLVCQLYACAELIVAGPDYAGPLYDPARGHAETLISQLA